MQREGQARRRLAVAATALACGLAPTTAHAYIGPGAGFAVVGSLLALILAFVAALLSLLTWPLRALFAMIRRRRIAGLAKHRRVIVLGLDGLDPRRCERLMAEGRMPNFVALAERGDFRPLGTTDPPLSPVAWSSFATGVHPARHAIFDFLDRDLRNYLLELSSSRIRPPRRVLRLGNLEIPLSKPEIEQRRRSRPFWAALGKHGVDCRVLRVPITYPPEPHAGQCISGMCCPDLRGTQGSFTHIVGKRHEKGHTGGLELEARSVGERRYEVELPGPDNPINPKAGPLTVRLKIEIDADGQGGTLWVGRSSHRLKLGEHSDWVNVRFGALPFLGVHGIFRARLGQADPLSLYITPIQIDPEKPALPISTPTWLSTAQAHLHGPYSTLGLAEDTWALNEGVLDHEGFEEQAWLIHEDRETLFFDALSRIRRGVVAMVFDTPDRLQHMFMRHDGEAGPRGQVIDSCYEAMDDLLARTQAQLDPENDLLLIVSDHGFTHFRRGVNLNAWLRDEGYLTLKKGKTGGELFDNVDWSRTRAYAFGLTGIYLNVAGREAAGIVPPAEVEALSREIAEKLEGLQDSAKDAEAVRRVRLISDGPKGPYVDRGPELLVGYAENYRASWEGAMGQVTREVLCDNDKAWSGDHCVDSDLVPGVLFSNRPLPPEKRPHIVDIAPTVLERFGITPPRYMEGQPLFED